MRDQESRYRPWRDATALLTVALYTRGLWTSLFVWRALSVRPFKARAVEWGVDEAELRMQLRCAWRVIVPLTIVEGILFLLSISWLPNFAGYCFVLLVVLQWSVLPWLAARLFLRRDGSSGHRADAATLVTANEQSPLPDLGFLLREASFAVDTGTAEGVMATDVIAAELYADIERKFTELQHDGIYAQRVRVLSTERAQPVEWSALGSAMTDLGPPLEEGSERILVFGQEPGADGLAAVEFSARTIRKHLSLEVRARWLPPLRNRFSHLACLPMQKVWWRGVAVPVIFASAIFAIWAFLHLVAGGSPIASITSLVPSPAFMAAAPQTETTEPPPATDTATESAEEAPQASETVDTSAPGSEPTNNDTSSTVTAAPPDPLAAEPVLASAPPDPLGASTENSSDWTMLFAPLIAMTGFAYIVRIAAIVTFLPLFGFFLLFVARVLRYIRGCLYAATGTMLNVSAPRSYRLRAATLTLGDDGALRSGLAYLHVIEQSLLDAVIATLQNRGIDTQSIREESRVLINEGIYMTGGSLQASNVAVGSFAKIISRRKRKLARDGRVTYGAAMRGKKEVA